MPSHISRQIAVSKKNFKDLSARSFHLKVHGYIFHGFIVRKKDKYFAYQNLCQHLAISLDLKDDNFFNHDKTFLQCHMHGALYEIETGECKEGPCVGARLVALELIEEETRIVITVPEKFER